MSANLITGNLFKPIYAYQDADYQAGISGNVTSIMPVGSKMALSIEDANTIKADDGVLITKEGRRIQIDAGAIEEWSIPTGTQGATNYFIIGFHLYTDSNSAEVCETFVEQMESATDTIPEGTFREGATEVYISLGRVVQSGINLDSVTSLVQIAQSFEDVKNAITQLNSDLNTATVTNRSSLLSGGSDYIYTDSSKIYDVKIGKIHILNLILEFKANANTGGYKIFGRLPYQIISQASFSISAWQNGSSCMGVIESSGDIVIAAYSAYGANLEHRAQVVVYEK